MFTQAAKYAVRGRGTTRRLLLGSGLVVASVVAAFPSIILLGYWYRILEYPDASAPPEIRPLARNVAHGTYALAALAVVWLPALVVGIVLVGVATVVGGLWQIAVDTFLIMVAAAILYVTPAFVALHARGVGPVDAITDGHLRVICFRSPYAHAVIWSAGLAAILVTLAVVAFGTTYLLFTSPAVDAGPISLAVPDPGPVGTALVTVVSVLAVSLAAFVGLLVSARLYARGVASAAGNRLPSSNSEVMGLSASSPADRSR